MAERAGAGEYESARLMSTVLTLYYRQQLTQAEVAKRLGLSTAKVNRLLQQAREEGMVEIIIRAPLQHLFDLEARLKAIFNLREVLVIPRLAEDASDMAHTLGAAAAGLLLEHLQDGDIVAIGGGTGVNAVVQGLEARRSYAVRVVPLLGAVQGSVTTDVNYLAVQLATRLGGSAYQLHAPAFADTAEERDALLAMRPIKEILDIARRATIALVGVGAVDDESSRYVQFTALAAEDMKRIAEVYGGVGEIGAHIYDLRGRPCAEEYGQRVVGLSLQELRRIPFIIGLAARAVKARPIYGALRGGYLDALVTDEVAAQGVLELFERGFRDGAVQ